MREKFYGQKMWLAAVDGLLDQATLQQADLGQKGIDAFLVHSTPGEKAAIEAFVKTNGLEALKTALTGYESILRLKAAGLKADISAEEGK